MDEENVMAEVMNLLEAEPTSLPAPGPAPGPGPDIPALREELAVLVSSGQCKQSIGVILTHEQVKWLDEKDVMRYHKRYKAYVSSKTAEAMIETILQFATKALGCVVKLKDLDALQNELKNDYIITLELSNLTGSIARRCGRWLAVANAFLISSKHVNFSSEEPPATHHPSRDSDGYPLAGLDEVPNLEQYSVNSQ